VSAPRAQLLDAESRSRCDLSKRGGRIYWSDPSTEALCVVVHDTGTGETRTWTPGAPCPLVPGVPVAAHNAAGFDSWAAVRLGWQTPAQSRAWVDTSELARTAGLLGALDALGQAWAGIPKDKAASRFTRSLSTPSRARARRGQLPEITPSVLDRVVRYCGSDVAILRHAWPRLAPWAELEPGVAAVDRSVNCRGVPYDAELAVAGLECDAENRERELARVARELRLTADEVRAIAQSPAQFCALTGAADAQKGTVEALLQSPSAAVRLLAQARRAVASIVAGKLTAGLRWLSPDGRLRDMHRYYGAHTGRWSGRGPQLQNQLRPPKELESLSDDQICALAEAVLRGDHVATQGELAVLLRACIAAPPGQRLVAVDLAAIEARMVAWLAGDLEALATFEARRDPYKVMAGAIFGVPYAEVEKWQRGVGKVAELACGYGMGPKKFGETARKFGSDLGAMGVSAKAVVGAWRRKHAPIERFWRECESAFVAAAAGRVAHAGVGARLAFLPGEDGDSVAIVLPSGRPIVYRNVRLGQGRYGVEASYETARGREHTYGGSLVENITQAACRDLLAAALVQLDRDGLDPVLHVHDEVVCLVDEDAADDALAYATHVLTTVPDWAPGIPLAADGYVARRYRK
jgi:DNA polymerase